MNFPLRKSAAPLAALFLLGAATARGEVRPGEFSAGLLSSGVAFQGMALSRLSLGVHYQKQRGVGVYGLRQRWYANPKAPTINVFAGLEENRVTFDIDGVRGRGWTVGAYVGLDYFVAKRWSLEMDAGPAFIDLRDGDNAVTNEGLDFVVNLGLNWHWGGR
jgi:hypothetical protein